MIPKYVKELIIKLLDSQIKLEEHKKESSTYSLVSKTHWNYENVKHHWEKDIVVCNNNLKKLNKVKSIVQQL